MASLQTVESETVESMFEDPQNIVHNMPRDSPLALDPSSLTTAPCCLIDHILPPTIIASD
jgi:hypothetical protein